MSDAQVCQTQEMPAFFLSHGGGPCFFMESDSPPFDVMDKNSDVAQWYREFRKNIPYDPTSIIVISAHWEEAIVNIQSKANPKLYFDYYGFPSHTYKLTYPAPGNPDLAKKVQNLLNNASIPCKLNAERDFDHGAFVPLKLMFPEANIPVIQISLARSLDPQLHLRIGNALRPLRKEGVLIFASGFATHNLQVSFSSGTFDWVKPWTEWLTRAVTQGSSPAEVRSNLINWASAPHARTAHPREEHLIPLHVAAGSAGEKNAEKIYDKSAGAFSFASYKWN